ncbi:MAG: 2-oxoacid:ferredoxin oxidoreductase subunit beta [Ectothiorhodospiraceae bacterium AqS1]|nr:2-oxoacid:ferredoxin oxidoreductase subunit beta [Ectothiorhodospiraceae bacterium AqS1]
MTTSAQATAPVAASPPTRLAVDFASDQEIRWCPGCGDFSILAQMKKALPEIGVRPENLVFVSGIGCSSRFPYYLDTYGVHGIHGRAPAIATGLKTVRPDLQVWVITGDGDALSIGGNHLMHALRRNVDIKILLFNNRIYGLTKGQYSPTSLPGHITRSTPHGSVDAPLHPLSIALGSEASFVARSVDTHTAHLGMILRRAAAHKGSAFVEIYQNCNIYNDGAFEYAKNPSLRNDHLVELEHGKPLIFGKKRDRGIRLKGLRLETVAIADDSDTEGLLVHDERAPEPTLAMLLARMRHPAMPEAIGVLRAVERPVFDALVNEQVESLAQGPAGKGELEALFRAGDTWRIE